MISVLSAGVGRSGSTWLHNAIMALLEQKYRAYGAWVDRWDQAQAAGAEALVLKVHGVDQIQQVAGFEPDVIATCHRDLRDVALSLRDYQQISTDDEVLKQVTWARSCHDVFSPIAHIDLAYEEMKQDPLGALARLSQILGIERADLASAHAAVEAWEPLPGDAQHRYDGRPGRWREQLSPTLREAIEAAHGDWLSRFGYLPEAERQQAV